MGRIVKPHGIKGFFKVFLYNRDTENFNIGSRVWLYMEKKFYSYDIEYVNLKATKPHMKISSFNSIGDLDKILNLDLYMLRSDFLELKKNENYVFDFIGCRVYDEDKTYLGTSTDVLCLPNQNLLVLKKNNSEFLVPLVDDFIKFFDIENKEIIVRLIDGLIDV